MNLDPPHEWQFQLSQFFGSVILSVLSDGLVRVDFVAFATGIVPPSADLDESFLYSENADECHLVRPDKFLGWSQFASSHSIGNSQQKAGKHNSTVVSF